MKQVYLLVLGAVSAVAVTTGAAAAAAAAANETGGWCVRGDKCKPVMRESDGNSYVYDLSALGRQVLKVTMDDKDYFVSVCGSVQRGCKSGTSVCQLDNEVGYSNCGSLATQKWDSIVSNEPGTGLQVEYTGDACDDGSIRRSTLTLMCDRTEEGRLVDVLASSCEYFFTVLSKHACGTRHQGGGGSGSGSDEPAGKGGDTAALVILILLLVAVAVYFAGGAVYQKKVHDPQSPREYVIHNGFWCALPGMVIDGCKFIAHGCKKGDYVSV